MKAGDLVKINVKKLKENGRAVVMTEINNPFGFIVKNASCKSESFLVILTETGERFWYSKKFLEVISE